MVKVKWIRLHCCCCFRFYSSIISVHGVRGSAAANRRQIEVRVHAMDQGIQLGVVPIVEEPEDY